MIRVEALLLLLYELCTFRYRKLPRKTMTHPANANPILAPAATFSLRGHTKYTEFQEPSGQTESARDQRLAPHPTPPPDPTRPQHGRRRQDDTSGADESTPTGAGVAVDGNAAAFAHPRRRHRGIGAKGASRTGVPIHGVASWPSVVGRVVGEGEAGPF